MKSKLILLITLLVLVSCAKKNEEYHNLLNQYEGIIGEWEPLEMSFDSLDIEVKRPLTFTKLVINDNLTYKIFNTNADTAFEHGDLKIIVQHEEKLELLFDAEWPLHSSFAGSHLFGFAYVMVEEINNNQLTFLATKNTIYPNTRFQFKKLEN